MCLDRLILLSLLRATSKQTADLDWKHKHDRKKYLVTWDTGKREAGRIKHWKTALPSVQSKALAVQRVWIKTSVKKFTHLWKSDSNSFFYDFIPTLIGQSCVEVPYFKAVQSYHISKILSLKHRAIKADLEQQVTFNSNEHRFS